MKRFLPLFVLLASLMAMPALAQDMPVAAEAAVSVAAPADPYSVSGIQIDMPTSNPVAARDEALAAALAQAYVKLKEQQAANGVTLPDASASQLNHLMKNFEVAGEKISARRYIGSYTINFRPAAVQQLAGGAAPAAAVAMATSSQVTPTASLVATYRFRALTDYTETEKRLKQTGIIGRTDVLLIGRGYVTLRLNFAGTQQMLVEALRTQNIDLQPIQTATTGGTGWQLMRQDAAL